MTDLNEQIARLWEFDAKRTQGEWILSGGSIWTNRDGEHVSIATTRLADTPFIAAAPTMMQIINQLQAKLQIAEGALEHYERGTNYETAQAALAQIRGKEND